MKEFVVIDCEGQILVKPTGLPVNGHYPKETVEFVSNHFHDRFPEAGGFEIPRGKPQDVFLTLLGQEKINLSAINGLKARVVLTIYLDSEDPPSTPSV